MSRDSRRKTSAWIVIDETGSEGDDDFQSKEDSDYEVDYRSSKLANEKDKNKVVNLDKGNRKTSRKDKDEARNSKNAATKHRTNGIIDITDTREERSSKADVTLFARNEITIEDEDDEGIKVEGSIPTNNRKRRGSIETAAAKKIKTTEAPSSKNKLSIDKTGEHRYAVETEMTDYGKKDSDYVVEYRSNKKTVRKDKDNISVTDFDKTNRKGSIKDKARRGNTSTAETGVRKKGLKSKADTREEQRSAESNMTMSSRNEIIIDDEDDEDIKLETDPVKYTKRKKGLNEIAAVEETKTVRASLSKNKLSINETGENRSAVGSDSYKLDADEQKDSDDVVECQFSKKPIKKDKDIIPVIDFDKPNRKATTKDKDVGAHSNTGVKGKRLKNKANVSKAERSSKADVTLLSTNEIIIDDDDDKDLKVKRSVPIKSSKRKEGLTETVAVKRVKTTHASSSKQKFDKLIEDVNDDSDSIAEYQSFEAAERRGEYKVPVSDLAKLNRKANTKEMLEGRTKRFNNEVEVREEQGSTGSDVTCLSENEITIDDEEDDDIKLKIEMPAKTTKRKVSNKTVAAKKAKTVRVPTSRNKVKIDEEDGNLSPAEVGNDRPGENKEKNFNDKVDTEWSDSDYLSEFNNIQPQIAENLISLFKNDNTIPFIARYRKEITGGMEPEQLRSIKNTYDNLKLIKHRALVILKNIDKLGKWSPEIHSAVTAAKTMDELEHIWAPFKPGTKGSLAERAKELGLAPIGESILHGRAIPSLYSLIDKRRDGLKTEDDVKRGIMHIIAEVISKDKTTFEGIHKLRKWTLINIETTKSKAVNSSKTSKNERYNNDLHKYENYFNFVSSEKMIKDYQILAINRAESQKILTVKIILPDSFQQQLKNHCLQKYNFIRKVSNFHYSILEESFNDAYSRLIKPLVVRQVRNDLNQRAESASIEVFARNLKKLLLSPPLRGKTILGIDPGFKHGCKLAVISPCGNVLETATIYPNTSSGSKSEQHAQVLAKLIKKYNCTIIALGNATACRETETFLTDLIQAGVFAPLDVSYTIVDEAGASIYSCSTEAKKEFPNLDPNIISAISIARRLQDPLAELIKVEPQHLGIGMYQLDLPKKQLQFTLDEVITETVSFVGVDINTASHCLLRKVAGLSATRATSIIERRNACGPFTNRKELLEVKGIGKKFFEQCAGFIRILPETVLTGNDLQSKKYTLDYLDQTWIHPESYDVARQFIKACKCDLSQLGTDHFIEKVLSYAKGNRKILADQFGTSETSMDIIVKGLSMKKGEDIRFKEDAPLFRKNLRCIEDLCVNTKVTGLVRNVTHFGIFVDIGVGTAGLIPLSKTKGQTLSLGQRVEVEVISKDENRGRITLSL